MLSTSGDLPMAQVSKHLYFTHHQRPSSSLRSVIKLSSLLQHALITSFSYLLFHLQINHNAYKTLMMSQAVLE